jgi:hypothetical protein
LYKPLSYFFLHLSFSFTCPHIQTSIFHSNDSINHPYFLLRVHLSHP